MPSRVEKNYNKVRINKRTIKNRELYENSDYKIISSTNEIFEKEEEYVPDERNVSNVLKTDKLLSLVLEEDKERDINKILKEAKSTRSDNDDLSKSKKLDNKEYNITKKINIDDEEAVSKFRNENRKVIEDEEELTNLIDTIYSKTSTSDLFDDLMPTSSEDTIISDSKELDLPKKEEKDFSNSFFTSSMELSDEDLTDYQTSEYDVEDADDSFLEEDRPIGIKIFVTILLVIIFISIIGFVIYKCFL